MALNDLKARVKAANAAHQIAMDVYDLLHPVFTPLVGQQVVKQDGQIMAKIKKLMPELPGDDRRITIFRNVSDYSLGWTVKVSEQVEGAHHCVYESITVYIGDVSGKILKDTHYERPKLRTDYTAVEILKLRKVYEEKKWSANLAKNDLWPFGERDS